jgi:hypothetical protein
MLIKKTTREVIMKLRTLFTTLAAAGTLGAYLYASPVQEAQALTPSTSADQSQINLQNTAAGFIRHLPFCCEAGERIMGFPADATTDGGYDVTIDPSAYGYADKPKVVVHVEAAIPWDGSWSHTHIFSNQEAAAVEAACKADPTEQDKTTCRRPAVSIIFAAKTGDYPEMASAWSIYCLVPPLALN